jgi:hypothetical protein
MELLFNPTQLVSFFESISTFGKAKSAIEYVSRVVSLTPDKFPVLLDALKAAMTKISSWSTPISMGTAYAVLHLTITVVRDAKELMSDHEAVVQVTT